MGSNASGSFPATVTLAIASRSPAYTVVTDRGDAKGELEELAQTRMCHGQIISAESECEILAGLHELRALGLANFKDQRDARDGTTAHRCWAQTPVATLTRPVAAATVGCRQVC